MEEVEVISSFFSKPCGSLSDIPEKHQITEDFLHIIDELNCQLRTYKVPSSVECIYNSTQYARYTFEMYVRKYCSTEKEIMYFGMNPGPWGMSQTGVPFGEISSVRDWLSIEGPVGKPENEIKARPVKGFQCSRSEVSGKRFWGLFKFLCESPENFFETSFVYNYLPQQWMKGNGCNLTPNDFKVSEMQELYNICDPAFVKVLLLYKVKIIVAVGKFCETRALKVVKKHFPANTIQIYYLPHPSPRTVNNNEWDKKAVEHLKKHNLLQYYTSKNTANKDVT